jgi:hypothetical protein
MTTKFLETIKSVSEALGETETQKVQITLELDSSAVQKIESATEEKIKPLLEREINENLAAFIEMMGYDNW